MAVDTMEYLDEKIIDSSVIGTIYGSLGKMMYILQFCGYNIERYINNYYNWLNPRDYNLQVTGYFKIISKNGNIVNDQQLAKMKKDNENEFAKIMAFFENHGIIFDKFTKEPARSKDYIACRMDHDKLFIDNKVKMMFRSALRLYMIDLFTVDPEKYQESDYTYLMVDYVKSLESFIFYKLNKYEPFNDYEKKHITFKDLEDKIKEYVDENVKDIPKGLLDQYTRLLSKFRWIYRNGYFHRDIQERKNAYIANDIATILIIMTEVILDT